MTRPTCPRLAVRIFLIMVGGIIAATFFSRWLIGTVYTSELSKRGMGAAVERIGEVVRVLDALPRESRLAAARSLSGSRLKISWPLQIAPVIGGRPELGRELAQLIQRDPGPVRLETLLPPPCQADQTVEECATLATRFALELGLADGQPVRVEYTTRYIALAHGDFVSWIVGLGALVLVVWLSVRIATRPLEVLAQHAEALGANLLGPPLDETGPIEVRHAARAFNLMQARILAQVNERTRMLAAISHDLKTPLTRLRLRLEQVSDEALRERLSGDLGAMRQLIDQGLELARSLETQETAQRVDLSALLEALCDDAQEAGDPAHFLGQAGVVLRAQANGLRRAFLNLIDNAIQYGGQAQISVQQEARAVVVRVRDRGPGIPPEHLEDVLKPYFRLENSRSRETGGSGLGLAIATNLLHAQGGQLKLRNHPEGGLEVAVHLPVIA